MATLKRSIDRLVEVARRTGALSKTLTNDARKISSGTINARKITAGTITPDSLQAVDRMLLDTPKGVGVTYEGHYYAPVLELPQGARKGRRVRTPDGTLWKHDTNSWNREWHKLLPQWREPTPIEEQRFSPMG